MNMYPIMLDMHGRPAVVVGGGAVGIRKVRSLIRAEASVQLVAKDVDESAYLPNVVVIRRPYRAEFLDGAALVFACTDDRDLNARIAADARLIGAFVNAADQPEDCDFFMPAVIRDGDVVVAVGTGGAAPALAKYLSRRLAKAMPKDIGDFAAALGELRGQTQRYVPDAAARYSIMDQLACPKGQQAFRRGGTAALQRKWDRLLAEKGYSSTSPRG